MNRTVVMALAAMVGIGTLASASPAQAYWWRGRWVGPVVVLPRPAVPFYRVPVYRPAYGAPVYAGPRHVWVRQHYNRFGYFVPGHWQ